MRKLLFTIGHSNRTFEELLELLRAHGVEQIVDVRAFPASRTNPQFNRPHFGERLRNRRIGYRHERRLGGRRKIQAVRTQTAWRNPSFRNFADYMLTEQFQQGLATLSRVASDKVTAILCSEALPWRCHRSLIADAMMARGWTVRDIMTPTNAPPHKLPAFARIRKRQVEYLPEATPPVKE